MKIAYESWAPRGNARWMVAKAEEICTRYAEMGYDLTLRQLYYQFVAADLIPNSDESYSQLGAVINRARMAGLLDWDFIVDRTRNLRGTSHWGDPSDIIQSAADSFRLDKWTDQPRRIEIWVEKEALAGIVERAAAQWDVNWFSCRGYVSQSEQWAAGRRIGRYLDAGQAVTILHLGDHDPSGIDMTRDIRDRLTRFIEHDWALANDFADPYDPRAVWKDIQQATEPDPLEIRRIALNRDQIRRYQPPPNPAKVTDSRAKTYIAEHGYQSWELDALNPETLAALISQHIEETVHLGRFRVVREVEEDHRRLLAQASREWHSLAAQLD